MTATSFPYQNQAPWRSRSKGGAGGTLVLWLVLSLQWCAGPILNHRALLAAELDQTGPRLVSAVVDESGSTNRIRVIFSEYLHSSSAGRSSNYVITDFRSANQVPVLSAIYSSSNVVLQVGASNWNVGALTNYYLTVNYVRDLASNNIAPDSRIGISRTRYRTVLDFSTVWRYQPTDVSGFEPNILARPWTSAQYVESGYWGQTGVPILFGQLNPWPTCLGGEIHLALGSTSPALFRARFVCSPAEAAAGRLRFGYEIRRAAIFYLNGTEVARMNLPFPPANLTNQAAAGCVTYIIPPPECGSFNTQVTNLLAGTNTLAVAVLGDYCLPAGNSAYSDIAFALEGAAGVLETGPLPPEEQPLLQIASESNNLVRLWWVGSGFALETWTNFAWPIGTNLWKEVPDMSNPYLHSPAPASSRIFRLRK